jgi:preprotein translocase subunit SecF
MRIDFVSPKFASALTSAAMLATTGVLPFITYFIWQMPALPEPEAGGGQ